MSYCTQRCVYLNTTLCLFVHNIVYIFINEYFIVLFACPNGFTLVSFHLYTLHWIAAGNLEGLPCYGGKGKEQSQHYG